MLLADDYDKIRGAPATPGVMTKYEFTSIIGLRTTHIANGAPPLVELPADFQVESNYELRAVAIRELREGKLPFIVKRTLPNGQPVYCRVRDLDLAAVRHMMR